MDADDGDASTAPPSVTVDAGESGKLLGEESEAAAPWRNLQGVLMVVVVLLSVHSVAFLYQSTVSGFDLETASTSEQLMMVWCSGWITAATTGFGALPFFCVKELSDRTVAACNAVAAGMMTAASIGLIAEGCLQESTPGTFLVPAVRVLLGMYLGAGFVKATSMYLGESEPSDLFDTPVLDMRRALLIMSVMTLHSISEGIGIGVSYSSQSLGGFVTASLAVHNIPEGLAIAVVLIPRRFSLLSTTLWCVFSSLPQPIMALPAYLFTQQFIFVLPIGLGLAAGAMGIVVVTELIPESMHALSPPIAYSIAFSAMMLMGATQVLLRENSV